MESGTTKYTIEALAFMTLLKSMPLKIQNEVRQMIVDEDLESEAFTKLSLQTWDLAEDRCNKHD